jgi:hypothetical protein
MRLLLVDSGKTINASNIEVRISYLLEFFTVSPDVSKQHHYIRDRLAIVQLLGKFPVVMECEFHRRYQNHNLRPPPVQC